MFAKTEQQPRWRQRGYSSAAEARQERRSMYGTNSSRQRSRYHDEGLPFAPVISPDADEKISQGRRQASVVRNFDPGDRIPIVTGDTVIHATVLSAWVSRGDWMYFTDSYTVSQTSLNQQVLPLAYVAEQLADERAQILALKRGSRRRDTRRIN